MFHDGAQVAGLLVDAKLALGAGAFVAVTRGTPLVFLDEGAAVNAEAHVAGVKAVQFNDDGLCERGDGNGFFDAGGDIAHAEFEGAKRGMRADVPPDFLAAVDAVELDEKV